MAPSTSSLTDILFERSADGLCLVAPGGTILRANPEWLRATGFTAGQVIGVNVVELFPDGHDLALALRARARDARRVELPRHAQWIGGRETWWVGSVEPVPMDDGTGLLLTAREVGATGAARSGDEALRAAVAALDEERRRFAAVLDALPAGVAVADASGRITHFNAALERIWGNPPIPRSAEDYREWRGWWADGGAPLAAHEWAMARALATGEVVPGDVVEIERFDGSGRAVIINAAAPIRNAEGRIVGGALAEIDITRQKRAEEALAAEKERYRGLFQYSLDAVYLTRADGTILDANPAACRLHGMTVDEIKAAGRAGVVVGDERHAAALGVRASAGQVRTELSVRRKDGSTVPVEVQSVLLDPAAPNPTAFVISRDISERKRAEEELRANLAISRRAEVRLRDAIALYERQVRLFEGVAATTPDFVYLFDTQGRFLYANRRLLEVWGMALPDVVGKTCRELGYPQWHHDLHMREIAQVIETRGAIKGEVPFEAPRTGVFGVYEYIFTPVIGPDGEVEIVAGTTRDVTERKRTDDALRASEERYRALVTATSDAVYRMSADWAEMRHLRGREFIAETDAPIKGWMEKYIHPDDRAQVGAAVAEAIRTRGTFELEHRVLRRDGSLGWTFSRAVPITDASGAVVEWIGMASDVTERKRAQEAILAANEKLVEADRRKDEFLGMLSHELRNPLAPIRNATHILQQVEPGCEQARRAQSVIERQTEHLARLVDDLLDLTRIARGKIALRRDRIDLRDVVSRAADDFRLVLQERGVSFRTALPDATLWADADPTRIAQVVGNLLHNAAKFTRPGDEVALTLGVEGEEAELRVRDTGAGIDGALLPQVFDPFIQGERTLARTEGGLGLGLALVRSVAELHGGTARAESAGKGRGAEFVVRLPLAGAAPALQRGALAGEPANGGRRVLVVDDNEDAAETLADVLSMMGHAVVVAHDGASALAKARELAPDVVLCDIGLPGMSGYDVAKALRADGTGARLFAVSGYAQPEDVRRAIEAGFDGHLAKPPKIGEIERLLAGAS